MFDHTNDLQPLRFVNMHGKPQCHLLMDSDGATWVFFVFVCLCVCFFEVWVQSGTDLPSTEALGALVLSISHLGLQDARLAGAA